MKKKCTKKKLTAEQKAAQLKKRKVLAFRKKIRSSFTDAGFTYFSTLDKHFPIGTRTVELDYLFLYENIIVICEDNTKQKKDIDHIRNKNESFAEIRNNKTAFLNWLSNTFPEKATMVKQYRPERYFLYCRSKISRNYWLFEPKCRNNAEITYTQRLQIASYFP